MPTTVFQETAAALEDRQTEADNKDDKQQRQHKFLTTKHEQLQHVVLQHAIRKKRRTVSCKQLE